MSSQFWDKLVPGRKPKPPKPTPVDPAPGPLPPPEPWPGPPAPEPEIVPIKPGRLTRITGPFRPRLYSYWPNAWVRPDGVIFVFGGLQGYGPQLYAIRDGQAEIFGWTPPIAGSETEGWYWNKTGQIYAPRGGQLLRCHPFDPLQDEVVFDLGSHNAIKQCHSSNDGQVHSATLNQTDTVVWYRGRLLPIFYSQRTLDESQISPDGEWLVIKETDSDHKLWNVIVKLLNGNRYEIAPGASIGHSDLVTTDMGTYIVGADAWNGYAVCRHLESGQQANIFSTWDMGHVSVRGERALWSRQELGHLALGSPFAVNTAPTPIFQHGETSDEYDRQVRANLSPCGRVATFTLQGDLCVLEL